MNPAILKGIYELDQAALDRAVYEEVFCYVGEARPFSTSSELAEAVIAELYSQDVIASANVEMEKDSGVVVHRCLLRRPFVGTEIHHVMEIEMRGNSIPIAICRAAVLLCRAIVSRL